MIKLKMVSGGFEKPKEPSLKVLLRSNLWNPVKTIHFLYGPLRSLKDMEVPDKAGNGIRGPGEPLGSYTKNFVKLGQQVPC